MVLNVLTLLHTPVWQQLPSENLKPYSGQVLPPPFSVTTMFLPISVNWTQVHELTIFSGFWHWRDSLNHVLMFRQHWSRWTPSRVRGTVFYCRHSSYDSVHLSVNGYQDCFLFWLLWYIPQICVHFWGTYTRVELLDCRIIKKIWITVSHFP